LGGLGSHTYTVASNIRSILISQASGSKGTINALALYQIVPANTYADWINSFAFADIVAPDLSITGDPDNDGLDNALENIFGTSPEVFSQGLASVATSGGNLVFRHTLGATPASDLTGAYEWSTDLVNWHAAGTSAGGTWVSASAAARAACRRHQRGRNHGNLWPTGGDHAGSACLGRSHRQCGRNSGKQGLRPLQGHQLVSRKWLVRLVIFRLFGKRSRHSAPPAGVPFPAQHFVHALVLRDAPGQFVMPDG
jgi:hypothetical protein